MPSRCVDAGAAVPRLIRDELWKPDLGGRLLEYRHVVFVAEAEHLARRTPPTQSGKDLVPPPHPLRIHHQRLVLRKSLRGRHPLLREEQD